jgi:hypothetical protein
MLIRANKARYATHGLMTLLFRLHVGLDDALSIDVDSFIEEYFTRKYMAKLEIFME